MEEILEILPKSNCGKCGFDTCEKFARAVAEEKASSSGCQEDPSVRDKIYEIDGMGWWLGKPTLIKVGPTVFSRFHSVKYVYEKPSELWKCFDFMHSLKTQGRFAGKHINPGFYFGIGRKVAISEMLYHDKKLQEQCTKNPDISEVLSVARSLGCNLCLVEARGVATNVCDLTEPKEIAEVFRQGFPRACKNKWGKFHKMSLLEMIVSQERAGNVALSIIGQYLSDFGASAVRFPSARAVARPWKSEDWTHLDRMQKMPRSWFGVDLEMMMLIEEIRQEYSNIVFFRPAAILSALEGYRIIYVDGPKKPPFLLNPFYHCSQEKIYTGIAHQGGLTKDEEDELVEKSQEEVYSQIEFSFGRGLR